MVLINNEDINENKPTYLRNNRVRINDQDELSNAYTLPTSGPRSPLLTILLVDLLARHLQRTLFQIRIISTFSTPLAFLQSA